MFPRTMTPTRTMLLVSVCLALCAPPLVAPPPAHAGIGNPLKKAKEKLSQKAQRDEPETITNDTIVFDDLILELTDERIDRIIAAQKASESVNAGREAAAERANKANNARAAFMEKNGNAINAVQQRRDDLELCYHDGYHEAQEKKSIEYSQKALTDPAIRDKFAKAAQQYNAAAAAGDSNATAKLHEVLYSETIISTADSAEVRKRCGALPPITPAEIKLAALDKEIADANEAIRDIDIKAAESYADDAQMNGEQFLAATERIRMYLAVRGTTSKPPKSARGFTEEEVSAMEKRLADLRASLK